MYFANRLVRRPRCFIAKTALVARTTTILLAAALAITTAPLYVLAQQEKTLQGVVRDPLGARITNASVDLL